MAVAAATAVIAPAAFLAAPAAYATDGTTGTTETVSDDENPPPPADDEVVPPPVDDTVEPPPVDDDVVPPPVDDENPPPPVDPPVNPPVDDTVVPPPVDEGENPEPGDDEGEEEEEEEPTPPDEECADGDFKSTLSGLPSKIVAGSGWKEFSLNLDNKNGDDVATIVLGAVVLYKKDAEDSFESDLTSKYAKFEYFDGKKWVNDDLSDGGSFAGALDVEAGETYSLKLRMNVSAKAPAGAAVAIAFAVSVDDDLNCHVDEKWYSFEVLAADSTPGSVPPAEPEDGKSPADIKPQGGAKALPAAANGSLAETGSNSALPAVGIAAALAVAVGGGVVFALRRREGDAVA
ncbi:LAETG motif-containing sortase-dependent surface protein [Streptomyces niveus]|uniref:LAETG motif-containing sortase-dependent surface protein n=1 Tax=Streptomyces niveus TaxID=193462 RepID=UPI0033D541EE